MNGHSTGETWGLDIDNTSGLVKNYAKQKLKHYFLFQDFNKW